MVIDEVGVEDVRSDIEWVLVISGSHTLLHIPAFEHPGIGLDSLCGEVHRSDSQKYVKNVSVYPNRRLCPKCAFEMVHGRPPSSPELKRWTQ